MQLYAIDPSGKKVFAASAAASKDYFCQECSQRVRMRKSRLGRFHFFHILRNSHCRSAKKSVEHIAVQNFIQKAIGEDLCQQEVSFPEIGRIADLVWQEQNLVIEVQCSQITKKEVEKRMLDYASIGFSVVWILSDSTFNQRQKSPAEKFLEERSHCFVSVEGETVHALYDLCARGKKRPILDITSLKERKEESLLQNILGSKRRTARFWIQRFEYYLRLRFLRCIWNLIIESACR
jgi:competence CoiA-like predicted nuclease